MGVGWGVLKFGVLGALPFFGMSDSLKKAGGGGGLPTKSARVLPFWGGAFHTCLLGAPWGPLALAGHGALHGGGVHVVAAFDGPDGPHRPGGERQTPGAIGREVRSTKRRRKLITKPDKRQSQFSPAGAIGISGMTFQVLGMNRFWGLF